MNIPQMQILQDSTASIKMKLRMNECMSNKSVLTLSEVSSEMPDHHQPGSREGRCSARMQRKTSRRWPVASRQSASVSKYIVCRSQEVIDHLIRCLGHDRFDRLRSRVAMCQVHVIFWRSWRDQPGLWQLPVNRGKIQNRAHKWLVFRSQSQSQPQPQRNHLLVKSGGSARVPQYWIFQTIALWRPRRSTASNVRKCTSHSNNLSAREPDSISSAGFHRLNSSS
jgi:hypothetical protein